MGQDLVHPYIQSTTLLGDLYCEISTCIPTAQGKYLLTVAEGSDLNPRFLILPSPPPVLSLMIKSIAVQELMMPQEVPLSDDQSSQETNSAVEHCLDTVMRYTYLSYEPLSFHNGSYFKSFSMPRIVHYSNFGGLINNTYFLDTHSTFPMWACVPGSGSQD